MTSFVAMSGDDQNGLDLGNPITTFESIKDHKIQQCELNAGVIDRKGQWVERSTDWRIKTICGQEENFSTVKLKLTAGVEIEAQRLLLRLSINDLTTLLGSAPEKILLNGSGFNNIGLFDFPTGESTPDGSWWAVLQGGQNSRSVFLGFDSPVMNRTFFRYRDNYLEIGCHLDRKLQANETFTSDTLLIMEGDNVYQLLEQFGKRCSQYFSPRISDKRDLAWNSWDYYFSIFEEKDVDETLKAFREANAWLPVPVKTMVLDMGWQTDFGDWIANGRFPSGLKGVADKICNAGLTPGIWLAPFIVHWTSKAYLRNPKICATNQDGAVQTEPWAFAPVGRVDPTCPQGRQFLFDTFAHLYDAGFRYFKLDFLHYLITMPEVRVFHENHLGRIEIIRKGLQIIREAVGDDSYMLTCGCPIEAVIGIADGHRIGGDISTYHSTTTLCSPFLAANYWMNGQFFVSDPDFLIVRSQATAIDEQFCHNPYHGPEILDLHGSRGGKPWSTLGESRIWATLVALSGGALTLADRVECLNADGREMIAKALKISSTRSSRPLDLMKQKYPSYWLRQDADKTVLGVINWSETESEFSFNSSGIQAVEFWTDQSISTQTIRVPARDARILVWPVQNRQRENYEIS